MKIKTSELQGAALDWAVAKCEGDAAICHVKGVPYVGTSMALEFNPSTDWSQGGPIIERGRISIFDLPSGVVLQAHPTFKNGDVWEAEYLPHGEDAIAYCGPTPLIAAMRCYVASKLGEEVDIPDELAA